jgi:hypothetical protein
MEQRIATGFQRCNVTTNEVGIIDDEYAEIYAKDRADTVGAVWLGMTVGCATCHDHKFDPISQKDFYALGAFFRNTTQKVMDGNVSDTPPILLVPRQKTVWALLLPLTSRGSSELKSRRNTLNSPLESIAVNAKRAPSGDRANAWRVAAPSSTKPRGGCTARVKALGIAGAS